MVSFIGAGPGDPELLTIKVKKLIDSADVIIYAGSLVNPQVLADAKKLLSDHRSLLDEVALYLLAKETITGDELMQYVNANQTAQPASISQEPAED